LDLISTVIDLLSVAVLVFVFSVGYRALRAFKQSKQAVTESASILAVIVSALTSRIQTSESLVADLQEGLDVFNQRTTTVEDEQSNLRTDYLQVLDRLEEILSNDKRLILELERLKTNLTVVHQKENEAEKTSRQGNRTPLPIPSGDVLAALTPTERHTLEILAREGPKQAPELGRRMRKSREHMARLLKKLYLEGYVDRESNHAPFRYKLNQRIEEFLEPDQKSVTVEAPEKA
jgi:chromosome segregation ATPase